MNESRIQKQIIDWINSCPNAIAENVSGNSSQSGRADINACIMGRALKIEVKRPDSSYDATKKQRLYLKKWARAGAFCYCVLSLQELKQSIFKDFKAQNISVE